jgi:hypothetical protein
MEATVAEVSKTLPLDEVRRAALIPFLASFAAAWPAKCCRGDLVLRFFEQPQFSAFSFESEAEFTAFMAALIDDQIIYEKCGMLSDRPDEWHFGLRPWMQIVLDVMAKSKPAAQPHPAADQGGNAA